MPIKATGGGGSSDAQGTGPKAKGINSHAEGKSTSATGADAHAEGLSTSAYGLQAHAEGSLTVAADYSHAEGLSTTASGVASHAEGDSTIASASYAHASGYQSQANGAFSRATGRQSVATRWAQEAMASGDFAALGDAQRSAMVLMTSTPDATPKVLTAGPNAATVTGANTNVLTVPVSKAHRFRIEAIAMNTGADEFAAWTITGTIVRTSSGNARFIATPVTVTEADAAAAAWTLVASVNTGDATNNYLALTATGEAAKTIRWVAALYTTEVG